MFSMRILVVVAAWFLGASLGSAQLVSPKQPPPKPAKKSLVIKIDSRELPPDARLRLGRMSGHRYAGAFSSAQLSPDGNWLVVNGMNTENLTLIDLTSGKTLQEIPGRLGGGVMNMSFSADGKTLAVSSFQDMRVIDLVSGKQLRQFQHRDQGGQRQLGPSFSHDGKIVAVGSEGFGPNNTAGQAKAWEVTSGKLIGPFQTIHNYNVRVAVAPDGKTLASWGQWINRGGGMINNNQQRDLPRTIQVWDLATGKELRQLKLEFGPQNFGNVHHVAFTPDGKTIAVASGGSTYHLLDYETGKETRRFFGQRNMGASLLRISPDGDLLAVYDSAGSLQAWELKSGKRLDLVDGPRTQLLSVGFPGNKKVIALGNQAQSLHWWDATAAEKDPPFQGHLTGVVGLAFTPDGKSVLSAGNDQRLLWWSAQTGEEQRSLRLISDDDGRYGYYPGGGPMSFAVAPDGKYAATLSNAGNGGVRLWDLKTGKVLCDFEGPRAYNQIGIAFSPDSSKLAASGAQQPLHIWDIRTAQELPRLPGANANNNPNDFGNSRVAFSPNGKTLAVHIAKYDRFTGQPISDLILWDLGEAKEIHRAKIAMPNNNNPNGPGGGGMAFSSDGKFLAVCEGAGSILLLNATTGAEWRRLRSNQRNSNFQLAFSADKRFVAAGSLPNQFGGIGPFGTRIPVDEPLIEIWEVASGQLREQFRGHTSGVTCLAFSPDGATLASGSLDATVILWDFTGKSGVKMPPLTAEELPQAWKLLASEDKQVPALMRRMIVSADVTLPFLKEHFSPVKEAEITPEAIDKLIRSLNSGKFEVRDRAMRELLQLGERVEQPLRQVLEERKPTLEVRRRIGDLLVKMERSSYKAEELQALRGIEVLERIGTEEARAWLTALAGGTSTAVLSREAQAALKRLQRN